MTKLMDAILQEETTIRTLMIENKACKGCQTQAIEYHLAVKRYLVLLKELCDVAADYLGTTLYCLDEIDKMDIRYIAKEEWPKDEH